MYYFVRSFPEAVVEHCDIAHAGVDDAHSQRLAQSVERSLLELSKKACCSIETMYGPVGPFLMGLFRGDYD